jgi:hypothetical protein
MERIVLNLLPSIQEYIKVQLKICSISKCVPFTQIHAKKLLTMKSPLQRLSLSIQLLTHFLYLFAMSFFTFQSLLQECVKTKDLIGVLFVSINLLCFICRVNFTVYETETKTLVEMVLLWKDKGNLIVV